MGVFIYKQKQEADKQSAETENKQQELTVQLSELKSSNVKLYELDTSIEDEIKNAKQIIQMYLEMIKRTPKDVALERKYREEIARIKSQLKLLKSDYEKQKAGNKPL